MATPKTTAFEVQGADGRPIHGNVHSSARPGEERPSVVICHGFKGFKDWGMFPIIAARLATAGFTAIRFNFSGAGVSDGERFDQPERFRCDTWTNQVTDLGLVLDWLDAPRVGVLGHSRGGGVSILRAARDDRISALVTWAAVATPLPWDAQTVARWRSERAVDIVNTRTGEVLQIGLGLLDDLDAHPEALDIGASAHRVNVPWLVLHGADDEAVPAVEAEQLARAASPAVKRDLRIVSGGSHTFGVGHPWAGSTPQFEEALGGTIAWFSRHLNGG